MAESPWSSRLLSLYPTSGRPRPALDTAGNRDVLFDRGLAALFDLLICYFVIESPVLYLLDALTGGALSEWPLLLPASLAVLAPLVSTYSFGFEWRYGRTPGKVWRGLVVVDEEGGDPGLGAVATRNLCRYVDYLGVPPVVVGAVASLLSARGKRVGDLLARTVVVRTR